jgi:manganese/zinc/iron transport system substrate-binding protein
MVSLAGSLLRLGVSFCLLSLAVSVEAAPLQVVTTTTMVTDLVTHVGGERVVITGLMGAGVDPHLYKPTASDVTKLKNAEVVFFSGLHLEGRMAELFERLGKGGKKVFAVTSTIPKARLLRPAEFEGHFDPHVWGDAELWSMCIESVVKGLSEADPAGADGFAKRGADYKAELGTLHQWALKRAAELPEKQRILITSHDAFNYLGRAYGFKVVGVQGISTVTEAGLADVSKVVDFIKSNAVRAIFVESSVPRAAIERISKDSGAKIGGELFSDAMGTPGTKVTLQGETYDEGTYNGMLKHNINTVVEALK